MKCNNEIKIKVYVRNKNGEASFLGYVDNDIKPDFEISMQGIKEYIPLRKKFINIKPVKIEEL